MPRKNKIKKQVVSVCIRCGYEGEPEIQTGHGRCPVCHHPMPTTGK